LDIILKPLCNCVKSYVKYDIDFVTILPKTTNLNAKLVTFDVTSLYTNIPHDLGMDAVR